MRARLIAAAGLLLPGLLLAGLLLAGLLLAGLLLVGAAGPAGAADPCAGIQERLENLQKAVAQIEEQRIAGDQRLLEVHAVIAAMMAERMQMRVTVDRAAWEASAHRLAVQVNLLFGVVLGRPLKRESGDHEAHRVEVLEAAMTDGLFRTDQPGALEKLKALPARAEQAGIASGRLTSAAIEVLRGVLGLSEAVAADGNLRATVPLVAPAPKPPADGPLGLRDSDLLFTKDPGLEPRAAELRAKAAQLDSALAALAVAGDRERRPSEALRPALEKAKEKLNAAAVAFTGCKK